MRTAVIVGYDALSPYGMGARALWDGLQTGRTAIQPCPDFHAPVFRCSQAARVPLTSGVTHRSRVMHMLSDLLAARPAGAPADANLLVATTTGEIDRVEQMALRGADGPDGALPGLLPEIATLTGAGGPAALVSAACASATAALARALMLVRSGASDAVLIVAVDGLSEFLFSGFSALMALDLDPARPFDRDRAGLSLGEAATWLLVMSDARAARENRPVLGGLAGAGWTNDANHMTGPSRDGSGLARAMRQALRDADAAPDAVALVAAHGTGTRYNDAMEMKALAAAIGAPKPTFSLKGATGHTMGNAGLLQAVVALEALGQGCIPPTVGLRQADEEAVGWVSPEPRAVDGTLGLVVNAGFGGINAVVALQGMRPKD